MTIIVKQHRQSSTKDGANDSQGVDNSDFQSYLNKFSLDVLCDGFGWGSLDLEYLSKLIQIYSALYEENRGVGDFLEPMASEMRDGTNCNAWLDLVLETIFGRVCDLLEEKVEIQKNPKLRKKLEDLRNNYSPDINSIASSYDNLLDQVDWDIRPDESRSEFRERVIEEALALLRDED